ncbi:phenylacetate--CoA ligase family protein [Archaeoglobus profundus]|uniref:Phenylacetate--CoA ligase n=1 Tax=Archaeoglobus profundus (strain DSM 5631 / JCM 9629 / NBRC 100127 / Av18) TaxID=572546 RepID=D2RGL8_ARCPA|nr:phenylacetate--CoA ligase [Archaeoglobus profundus]ADB57443.1 Phenylacetate--CoA ligase [Archaeoglobus profundus DSM 5631]
MRLLLKAEKGVKMSRKKIEEIKNRRFRRIVRYVYQNCPFYRRKFKSAGIDVDKIRSVEDISKLPFTTKQELREAYPLKILCVPKEKVVRIQMSGGTTGQPVIIPYTRKDVEQWKEMMLRAFYIANITSKDVIQITPAFGLWNGGFGFHFAADAINAFVVPIGPGNTRNQLRFMRDFGTTVLCSTASYPLRLLEVAKEMGIDLNELELEKMLLGAEPWTEEMRKIIEREFDVIAYDIPGLTEMGGVGTVGFECPERMGLHMWEDNYIVEVVDPETGEVLDEGEEGEVVYTALNREAMPLIRYRSGEVSAVVSREPCECGIEHMTIRRIRGRTDDMIIYRGVKFYPADVEEILASYGITQYRIVLDSKVIVEFEGDESLVLKLARDFKEFLGFKPKLVALPFGTLERFEGKAKRLVKS